MNQRATTAVLVAFLFVATAALGLTIGTGGFGGTPNGPAGGAETHTTTTNRGPKLVINATAVGDGYLYASTSYVKIPSYMLSPLAGLKVVLTGEQLNVITRPGRPPTYQVFTNSTGMAETYLPRGNYSVQAGGADFNITGQVRLLSNTTTYLAMTVYPAMNNVSYIQAVNPIPTVQVGTSSVLYILVEGAFHYSPYGTYQLVGAVPYSTTPVTIPGTIEGAYGSPGGTLVVMSLSSGLQDSFVGGARLIHFQASYEVTYANSITGLVSNVAP